MAQPVKSGLNVDPTPAQTLTTLRTDAQLNAFVFWTTGDRERQSRLFAEQVVAAARESLARLAPERCCRAGRG